MGDKKTLIGIVAAIIVVAVGSALVLGGKSDTTENSVRDMPSESSEQATTQGEASQQSTLAESEQSAQAISTTSVGITDYAFDPKTITVKVGDTVTWTNNDTARHDVTSDDGISDGPASELFGKGESYSFKFTKAGTYTYFCSPHPYMKGTVVVSE